jgi:hypothetical protein
MSTTRAALNVMLFAIVIRTRSLRAGFGVGDIKHSRVANELPLCEPLAPREASRMLGLGSENTRISNFRRRSFLPRFARSIARIESVHAQTFR